MSKFAVLVFATVLGLLSTACQKSGDSGTSDFGYTHKLQINSYECETGEHHFSTESDYCSALENESLNNYCAEDQRREDFEEHNCPGTFTLSR